MLKYHNFDNDELDIDIRVNGRKLNLPDKLGREFITNMRNTYFALWDVITLTDVDEIKKKLIKNKVKAITIDTWGTIMQDYAESEDQKQLVDALSADGLVIRNLQGFINFAFSNDTDRSYFITESLRVYSSNIYSMSVLSE